MNIAAERADDTIRLAVGPVEAKERRPGRVRQGFAAVEAVVAAAAQ